MIEDATIDAYDASEQAIAHAARSGMDRSLPTLAGRRVKMCDKSCRR